MKYYIDTSLAIALVNEKDPNHEVALKTYPNDGKKVISKIVLAEMYSVYSRKLNLTDEELEAIVNYTLSKCGCEIEEVDLGKVIDLAIKISSKVKLKTLDLLHLSASIILDSEILSLDNEILEAKNKIRK
ncbi:type II toxin-antitoxin system VapC family toxin [Saccharolobus solfataricus]|uniref:PIN domain-containing protein n=3 Tax=Saccharolobus solfataricus TaxID=2287 RepID=Q97XL6_SACS2|nr:PIN domain-containing protein [Saccharolobus solfataricus]AAK41908.1 Hypothetical protein SSO1701 [Saccharolobus solfataricus P2]AKA74637.1 type II toxin-antitoxin system VapC family toxin [Saccharolobus solfataricus]AKA77331.1 type II toxin-antitoxin system VapC family toxin [Saccharolobus solfataricus]AKA80022.1 type II toxin-antitoxin system VapC family toxin [Saccharolobus solfataricus]AZF69102.1 type II toxin-antitoxin system VapC family toxin [Saccharolobus solfataricus]